jgi:hypothetical protein
VALIDEACGTFQAKLHGQAKRHASLSILQKDFGVRETGNRNLS